MVRGVEDLRARIAAAIYKDNGFGWSKYMCEEAADAVIAELKQQWRADFGYDGYAKCETRDEAQAQVDEFNAALGDDVRDGEQAMVMYRFVTDWIADE